MRKGIWEALPLLVAVCCFCTSFRGEAQSAPSGRSLKWKVAIGRFSNETQYGKGIFYDRENDPMAKQALDILSAKLAASGKFILLERSDADKLASEVEDGQQSERIAADYVILGSITEFGRKTTGKNDLFSASKTQMVEAAVSLRLVDAKSSMVIYSEEGKGYAELTSKTTLGFGGKSGYDATLSDKAISSAMDQLVENVINKCSDRPWRTYIISSDADGIFIAGGASQGLKVGDKFDVFIRGKRVKNPQTGTMMDLPGKKCASIVIDALFGENVYNEGAVVSLVEGSLPEDINSCYIEEIK